MVSPMRGARPKIVSGTQLSFLPSPVRLFWKFPQGCGFTLHLQWCGCTGKKSLNGAVAPSHIPENQSCSFHPNSPQCGCCSPPVWCHPFLFPFLSSTLPTWEDNSPARRASIIHVSPASSGLSLLNIVFIPSKYPLNLSFFHAKIALEIFFLHSFPSIRSTISTCMGAYLLSFLVHFLPYVLSSSNHLESILQPAEYFISIITHENSSF